MSYAMLPFPLPRCRLANQAQLYYVYLTAEGEHRRGAGQLSQYELLLCCDGSPGKESETIRSSRVIHRDQYPSV
jgi:hypothetical protein